MVLILIPMTHLFSVREQATGMTDPTKVATGLADLAMKVKDKADQAESNQSTCKILVSTN